MVDKVLRVVFDTKKGLVVLGLIGTLIITACNVLVLMWVWSTILGGWT